MSSSESVSVADESAPAATDAPLTGRSVFLVETVAAGVAVRPVFLTEDQRLLDMPAVFPDLAYAMAQIDDLRRVVAQHFAQAAQVGAQVIAAQAASAPRSQVPADAAPEKNSEAAA